MAGGQQGRPASGVCTICENAFEYVRVTKPRKVCSQECERVRLLENSARIKAERRKMINKIKSQPCVDCGWRWPWQAMGFDHVPERGPKLFEISQNLFAPMDLLLAEVAKCDPVCHNCHAVRTARRRAEAVADVE